MLIPDQIRLLVRPLPTFIFQAQVEVPQDLCHDDPHFQMCETVAKRDVTNQSCMSLGTDAPKTTEQ
jgi:hypothetical protein